jgi:peptidoglycan/xylan/chitin deacetylase (PgdA/CDA1 family)
MAGTIICGYDVETASQSSVGFLTGAQALHARLGVPWTIYLTGKTVESVGEGIRPFREDPLLSIGQHTYSHMLLKSVYMTPGDGKPVHGEGLTFFNRGGEPDQIREQVATTQELIRERVGIECRGLTGPWGYYRGLVDRPDLLEILQENGIRWIRTDARDARDCQPTPFEAQPHFYADQGFPEILELGIQGYQDDFYWERFDDRRHGDRYEDYLLATLEEVARRDWVWNVCSHDHGTHSAEDFERTKGKWIGAFLERAQSLGIRFASPEQLYEEMRTATQAA